VVAVIDTTATDVTALPVLEDGTSLLDEAHLGRLSQVSGRTARQLLGDMGLRDARPVE